MGYRLLIVDDSSIVRNVLKKALGMTGLDISNISEAENGLIALAKLHEERADLVFLDINMPVMNGMEFLQELRDDEILKAMPVIVVSTEGSDIRKAQLMELGISALLRKPVPPEILVETIVSVLGESKHDN